MIAFKFFLSLSLSGLSTSVSMKQVFVVVVLFCFLIPASACLTFGGHEPVFPTSEGIFAGR